MSSPRPDISVVVPTRGRPDSLARCLAALDRQRVAEPFEIVVVADGPQDELRVAEVVQRSPNARLLRIPPRGPGAARNAGAAAAQGSLICFTDDDCEPAPDWVAALIDSLRGGAEATAGRTTSGQARNRFAMASQLVTEYFAGNSVVPFAASNNLACRASLLQAVPFDERYPDAGGEDRDWCARIAARGVAIARVPGALVAHHQQLALRRFIAQQVRYGRGSYRYHTGEGVKRPFEGRGFYWTLLRPGLGAGPLVGLLVTLSQGAIAVGFGWEAVRARVRGR